MRVALAFLGMASAVLPAEAVALLPGVPMQPTRPGLEEGRITETDAGFLLESPGYFGWYDITVERDGKMARLIPEHGQRMQEVDWSQSAAVNRDRTGSTVQSAEESLEIIHEASGRW